MSFNLLKTMPVASLMGLTMMAASPVLASGGLDQPFCKFNGDKEVIVYLGKKSTVDEPSRINLKRVLSSVCQLPRSKMNRFNNISAVVWAPSQQTNLKLYVNGQITYSVNTRPSADNQLLSMDLTRGTSGSLAIEFAGPYQLEKLRFKSDLPITDPNPRCEQLSETQYRLDLNSKRLRSATAKSEYLRPLLEGKCPLMGPAKLQTLKSVVVSATSLDRSSFPSNKRFLIWMDSAGQETGRKLVTNTTGKRNYLFQVKAPMVWHQDILLKYQGEGIVHSVDFIFGKEEDKEDEKDEPVVRTEIITCESKDFEKEVCKVPGLVSAELENQLSETKCKKGETYFVRNNKIVVKKGCRAEFKVTIEE